MEKVKSLCALDQQTADGSCTIARVDDINDLIWEAALKNQQSFLIQKFGPNVNIGNVPPEDIMALEALRCGLRRDTLKAAMATLK
ncbi:MAG: hypothetical protein CL874_04710 [Dehalococcoidales bacterium]|jgi:phosphosulfolactate synthase|nr:hypothetical protein [Dehalococcoidales bacterium]MDP6043265.1 phosphosulfolactate synthase [Dehalococcoidales bacterium]MDP6577221.1 phosphosulfolactate synthase [Dehalococcoidales bacterium]MDP6825318.1 phosphosulfolactate synthase [Dehalococcoidales bacterium]|tara:strand:+ start:211 stop:465 length:255 start_codon:yes stop_codon:yes gene_type:complete